MIHVSFSPRNRMNPFSQKKLPKIAVIGAGLSGLTTALRLSERGFEVEVYEARNRVGGRILTVNVQGHLGELGGQNIFNGGQALHASALIKDLDLKVETSKFPFSIYYCEEGRQESFAQFLKKNPVPSDFKHRLEMIASKSKNMNEVLLALFPEGGLGLKIGRAMLSGYEGAPVEHLSVFYIETLYHLLLGGLSAAHQNANGDESVYIDRMVVAGGNSALPERLAEKLQGRVHLNHVLEELTKDPAGHYALLFRNERRIIADVVVLTIPCPVFKDITFSEEVIPAKRKQDIASIQYGTPSKILLPIFPRSTNGKQYATDAFVTFLDKNEHVANLFYVGGHGQFTEAEMQEKFARDLPLLQQIYAIDPSLEPVLSLDQSFSCYEGPVGHSWPNDPFAQGAYSCVGAGQEELFTSLAEVNGEIVKTLFAPIDDALFFTGGTHFHSTRSGWDDRGRCRIGRACRKTDR